MRHSRRSGARRPRARGRRPCAGARRPRGEPSSSIACATRRSGGPSRRTCSASGRSRRITRAGATEDDRAVRRRARGSASRSRAGSPRRLAPACARARELRQQREGRGQAADRVPERSSWASALSSETCRRSATRGRDRRSRNSTPRPPRERGADAAAAGPVGGGDRYERRHAAQPSSPISICGETRGLGLRGGPHGRIERRERLDRQRAVALERHTPAITPSTSKTGENQPPGR